MQKISRIVSENGKNEGITVFEVRVSVWRAINDNVSFTAIHF